VRAGRVGRVGRAVGVGCVWFLWGVGGWGVGGVCGACVAGGWVGARCCVRRVCGCGWVSWSCGVCVVLLGRVGRVGRLWGVRGAGVCGLGLVRLGRVWRLRLGLVGLGGGRCLWGVVGRVGRLWRPGCVGLLSVVVVALVLVGCAVRGAGGARSVLGFLCVVVLGCVLSLMVSHSPSSAARLFPYFGGQSLNALSHHVQVLMKVLSAQTSAIIDFCLRDVEFLDGHLPIEVFLLNTATFAICQPTVLSGRIR